MFSMRLKFNMEVKKVRNKFCFFRSFFIEGVIIIKNIFLCIVL